jgi:hypothetical protein
MRLAYREDKLAELMLYIAGKCETDQTFGAVKLCKILFFADFTAFLARGAPITGAEYHKLPQGPVPTRSKLVRERLVDEGRAVLKKEHRFGNYEQHKLIALDEPKWDVLSAEEVAIVDDVIERLWGKSAKAVSEISHEFAGWKYARDHETIPYESVCLPTDPIPLTDEDRAWAERVAAEL